MRYFEKFLMAEANPEGDAPAAAPDGDQQNNEGDAAEGDAAPEGDQQSDENTVDLYRPEGLPDHLFGENDHETMDKLAAAYAGARKELSKKNNVPEKLDDYKIELSEDLSSKVLNVGEDGTDPIFEAMRGVLHANGVAPEKGANIVSEFYGIVSEKMAEMQGAQDGEGDEGGEGQPAPLDFDYKTMGGIEKAQPVIDAGKAWITGLLNRGIINEADAKDMEFNLACGEGLSWMEKLRVGIGGEQPVPADMGGSSGSGGKLTEDDLNARVSDPRYQRGNPKFEQKFFDDTTAMFQQFYNKAS